MISAGDEYTPTPAVSHAILTYNHGRRTGLADGIVITPSHNPPNDGGFKYNPPNGGPATPMSPSGSRPARTIVAHGRRRNPPNRIRGGAARDTTHSHDYLKTYVDDLGAILDMDAIRGSHIRMASIRWAARACTTGHASPRFTV